MFLSPPGTGINLTVVKWAVIALASIGLLLAAYSHGRHVAEGEVAQAQRETALAYAAEIVNQQTLADQLARDNAALRSAQAPKDRIITKEIVKYEFITPPGQRCTLPGTFRLLHDAAATGQPPAPEAGTLAAQSADPVADAPLLQTIADNYATCRETAAQLSAWQHRHQLLEAQP